MKSRQTVSMQLFAARQRAGQLVFYGLLSLLTACGPEPDSRTNSDDAASLGGRDKIVTPPRSYYDMLLADRMQLANAGQLKKSQDPVLWINFAGATLSKGYGRGQSFIPCSSSVTVPPALIPADSQMEIAEMVAGFYSNAGAILNITTEQPTSGDYTTIHVGGDYSNLGCGPSPFSAGVAPYDVGNANPNDVGFVFTRSSNLAALARTIAHEAGHTYGLSHSANRADIMSAWDSPAATGFTSTGTQDAPAILQKVLGSGVATVSGSPVTPTMPTPPIAPLPLPSPLPIPSMPNLPTNFANLPGLANFANLSSILSSLPFSMNGVLGCVLPNVMPNANGIALSPFSGSIQNAQGALGLLTILMNASMTQNGGQFDMTQLMGLISGFSPPNITQIISLAGIGPNPTQCISQLIPVNIPGITASLPGQPQNGINVAAIFGMNSITNPGQLIAMIPQYAQVIGATNQGASAQVLMSLVLMATSQQYASILWNP